MATSLLQKSPSNPNDQRTVLVACVWLAAIVLVVFGQTLRYGFVNFDDEDYFTSNPHVLTGLTWGNAKWAFQIGYAANWHPLTWLSLMLDAQLFGTGPIGPHLTNIILHAANTVLLFLLLRRLIGLRSGATATQTGTLWACAFVAAIFGIHPLHVESVAWVSERKDVLSGLFFMLTLLMYTRYVELTSVQKQKAKVFYGLALMCFALGLMSKPMLVTLPFVLLLLDWWPLKRFEFSPLNSDESQTDFQRQTILQLVLEKLPFCLLSTTSCVVTILAQQKAIIPTDALPFLYRIGNASISYVVYLGQMFYPVGLAAFYPYPANPSWWKIVISLIFVASTTAGAFAYRRRCPYLLVGWLWYLGTLVPVIGLLQAGGQAWADRYTYLPLIGVFIIITWATVDLLSTWRFRRQLLVLAAFIVVAALMIFTSIQTSYWRSSESLWVHTPACTSRNYVAHSDLASVLAGQGRNVEAIGHYQQALEIKPDYAEAHNNLGLLLAGQGKAIEAIKQYQSALEIKPGFAAALNNLGGALLAQGRTTEAMDHFQKAAELMPDNATMFKTIWEQ